jgi:phosphonate transport system substrate-binding protein
MATSYLFPSAKSFIWLPELNCSYKKDEMISLHSRKIIMPVFIILTFFFGFLFSCNQAAANNHSITIGLLPEMNVFKQRQRFKPLATYLSNKLGIQVELTILSRYGNIIQRMQEQQVDAAFLGSFTGAMAISQLDVEPLARPINMDGTSTYFGHIFVRKDSSIKKVADMQGKSLALVERATTAGYVFPIAWLKGNGVDNIETYFSGYHFYGSHDAAIDAVLKGLADVGAAKNTIYDRVRVANPRIDQELDILASSPRVPSNGLCVRPELDEQYKIKLKELLLNLHHNPQGVQVLEKLGAKRFVETSREDYRPVQDMAVEAGIDMKNYKYYNP